VKKPLSQVKKIPGPVVRHGRGKIFYHSSCSFSVKSLPQIAATIWQLPKASCRLQQRFGNCQKLPVDCGNDLATAKSFLQIAATIWQLPKASCKLRQRNGNCQKLPANCSKEMAVAKRSLQIAAMIWQFVEDCAGKSVHVEHLWQGNRDRRVVGIGLHDVGHIGPPFLADFGAAEILASAIAL